MSNLARDLAQLCFKNNREVKGIISLEEAQEFANKYNSVEVMSSMTLQVFYFTDTYGFGYPFVPKHFVSSSTMIPHQIVPREGYEDGWVNTVKNYVDIFEKGYRQITSIDELVELLGNST